jgi:putative PIG3 family NAD(P)H quinone oxidoreductase
MRAIVITDGKLELRDVERPQLLSPRDVRVRVHAAGVNRADLLQRMGKYPAPPDAPRDIPGLELAGEVESTGAAVRDLEPGDRVFAIVSGGAYAEEVVLDAGLLAPIPEGVGFVQAAAIPEVFVTAYDAMVVQGGLAAGDVVLVHAAGSGVGTAAVQIARAIGARVIGTARSAEKLERAKELGLLAGIVPGRDPRDANALRFAEQVRTANGGRGVDVVLDLVGGAYTPESLEALDDKGRLVLVGLMAGARAEIDLGLVLRRRLRVFGTVLRARPLEEKILAAQVLAHRIAPLVGEGKLRAVVDATFPLEEAMAAHDHVASNAGFGKTILTL